MLNSMFPALGAPRLGTSLLSAQREMDQWFDRVFSNAGTEMRGTFLPLLVWEDDSHLHFEAELPGCTIEDVDLTVYQGKLRLAYTRKAPEENRRYWLNERGFGSFERTIALPDSVDPDSISAELQNGILHVALAKRPEVQPRKIDVQTPGEQAKISDDR